jgi:hypothetical protein
MKKLLLLAVLVCAATSLHAQSTVTFANTSGTLIRTNNLAGNVGNVSFNPAQVTYQLLVGAPGNTDAGSMTVIASTLNSTSLAGRFFGGTQTNSLVGPGGAMSVHVRGFIGSSWETATWTGASGVVTVTGGNPLAVPPGTPAAIFGTGLLQGFDVVLIPEPSTIALGLLGLGAVVMLRRRKQ